MAEEIKTRDERIAELLNKPATDAANSIKGPSLGDLATNDLVEPKVEEKLEVEDDESNDKKVRIPKSRLKTLTSKVSDLERQLQESQTYAQRIAELESKLNNKGDDELPDWWKQAYGDNELSKQGYKNQQRIMREETQRILAEETVRREEAEAERLAQQEAIETSFDEQMDELEETVGRELTSTQKAELLDIVGEYSPMEDGRYIGYMPVAKAYDIWQKGQSNQSKQQIANIAGIQSSGASSPTQSSEPPRMGDWRKRFRL